MWVDIRCAASILLVAAAVLAGGCATVIKGTSQEISVTTDPAAAACQLKMAGASLGNIDSTPGTLRVKKGQGDIEVVCKKAGYADASGIVSSSLEGWTFGNILLGGVIGVVVDASSGALHEYQSEIYVKLTPTKFASQEDRESFLDKWRSDILTNSAKAKIAASKQCSQQQCEEMLKRIDEETERALAAVESNRTGDTAAAAPTTQSPSSTSQPSAQPPGAAGSASAARDPRSPNAGDRWRYKLIDGKRPVGVVNIEVLDVKGYRVKERVTRDDAKGFIAERDVDWTFEPQRFQKMVTLPGGFQMAEISPYAAQGAGIGVGQRWSNISGVFLATHYGKRQILAEARVLGQETVRVPAGQFNAWRMEAVSRNQWGSGTVKITCNYWYAPEMMRTVKMTVEIEYQINVPKSTEIYELVAFEPAT
jgi:hypothetical protein